MCKENEWLLRVVGLARNSKGHLLVKGPLFPASLYIASFLANPTTRSNHSFSFVRCSTRNHAFCQPDRRYLEIAVRNISHRCYV